MRVLHIQLEGFSAAYPYPFLRSGTQLTLPAPPFSTVLGNLSVCAGRVVRPEESMIAFEFRSEGTAMDLERTRRLRMDNKTGKLRENPEQDWVSNVIDRSDGRADVLPVCLVAEHKNLVDQGLWLEADALLVSTYIRGKEHLIKSSADLLVIKVPYTDLGLELTPVQRR